MSNRTVEILRQAEIPEEVEKRFQEWMFSVWGPPGEDGIQWATPHWRIVLSINGQWMSHTGVVERTIEAGERRLPVGGICGVTTRAAHRRKGYSSQVLQSAARFIQDDLKLRFGLLLCEEEMVPFYARLGWQKLHVRPVYQLSDGKGSIPHIVCMVLDCSEEPWPPGAVNLCGTPW